MNDSTQETYANDPEVDSIRPTVYPSATNQQDAFDVSLRVRAMELALAHRRETDTTAEITESADKILAFLLTKS